MQELSLHILDVVENSLIANAMRVEIIIIEDLQVDKLTIRVTDNGKGMSKEFLEKVLDPFVTTRTTRKVGLGLPLFAAAAERCNGDFTIKSEEGRGTTVIAAFQHGHIDRAPLGNIKDTLLSLILSEYSCQLYYVHQMDGKKFEFDTGEIERELDGIPLSNPRVREWLSEFIEEGEKGLRG